MAKKPTTNDLFNQCYDAAIQRAGQDCGWRLLSDALRRALIAEQIVNLVVRLNSMADSELLYRQTVELQRELNDIYPYGDLGD